MTPTIKGISFFKNYQPQTLPFVKYSIGKILSHVIKD